MKRWLLWTLRCRRGRRCANLVVAWADLDIGPGSELALDYERQTGQAVTEENAAGTSLTVTLAFTCGACGTQYRTHVLVGQGGVFTEFDRERVAQ